MTTPLALNVAFLITGLVLLYFGGDFLVSGASGIARRLKIPVIVIGLTVVAFGTSAPELFVSLISVWKGLMPVSVGNVVGSNIINIALVLGLVSLVRPLPVTRKIALIDTPIMIGSALVLALVVINFDGGTAAGSGEGSTAAPYWQHGVITTVEGIVMVALLIAYLYFLYRNAGKSGAEALEEIPLDEIPVEPQAATPLLFIKVIGGVAGLALGGQLLVDGASWIAENIFGASQRFIGVTVVAFGTSLPELVTSLVAILKGETDISLGNVVGSNIFNSLLVLGATSLIRNIEIGSSDFRLDFLFMVSVSVLLFLITAWRRELPRWGGASFFAIYLVYFVILLQTRTI
ncbi:MAG: calcium/sodium antiporter [Spirochaetes bacterium]|jgi:cation:H+ antiporter|nr:calcium/sodium antiporter [Spirochaetota bacterium]